MSDDVFLELKDTKDNDPPKKPPRRGLFFNEDVITTPVTKKTKRDKNVKLSEETIESVKEELQDALRDNEIFKKRLDALKTENAKLHGFSSSGGGDDSEALNKMKKDCDDKIVHLQDKLQEMTTKYAMQMRINESDKKDCEAEIQNVRQQVTALDSKFNSLNKRSEVTKQQLAESNQEVQLLQDTVKNQIVELNTRAVRIQELQAGQAKSSSDEVKVLTLKLDNKTNEVRELKERIERQAALSANDAKNIESLQQERRKLNTKLDKAKGAETELVQVKQENADLKSTNDSVLGTIAKLNVKIQEDETRVVLYRKTAEEKARELETTNNTYKLDMQNLRKQLQDDYKKQLEELNRTLDAREQQWEGQKLALEEQNRQLLLKGPVVDSPAVLLTDMFDKLRKAVLDGKDVPDMESFPFFKQNRNQTFTLNRRDYQLAMREFVDMHLDLNREREAQKYVTEEKNRAQQRLLKTEQDIRVKDEEITKIKKEVEDQDIQVKKEVDKNSQLLREVDQKNKQAQAISTEVVKFQNALQLVQTDDTKERPNNFEDADRRITEWIDRREVVLGEAANGMRRFLQVMREQFIKLLQQLLENAKRGCPNPLRDKLLLGSDIGSQRLPPAYLLELLQMCQEQFWSRLLATYMGPHFHPFFPLYDQLVCLWAIEDEGATRELRSKILATVATFSIIEKGIPNVSLSQVAKDYTVTLAVLEETIKEATYNYNEQTTSAKKNIPRMFEKKQTENADRVMIYLTNRSENTMKDALADYEGVMRSDTKRLWWRYNAANFADALLPVVSY